MFSLQIGPSSNAYRDNSGPAGVSATVHCHTTLKFARKKSIDPTFEVTKPVRSFRSRRPDRYLFYLQDASIVSPENQGQTYVSSA